MDKLSSIVNCLSAMRLPPLLEEHEIHRQVACQLEKGGFTAVHEARLAPRCRIDFLCEDIGIEIKKNRPAAAKLARQLERYAQCQGVAGLIVLCPNRLILPPLIYQKPVRALCLNALWGVSLS